MLINPEDQTFYGVLKMDLATRLQDVEKISSLYDSAMKTLKSTDKCSLSLCFSTAAVLGKWTDFCSIGLKLQHLSDGTLGEFHQAALQHPDIPDYEVLYSFVEDDDFSSILLVAPTWRTFSIDSCEVKLSNTERADAAQEASISPEIAQLKASLDFVLVLGYYQDSQKLPVSEHGKIIQNGCFYQCVGISAVSIPIFGPVCSQDRLLLKGHIDIDQSPVGPVRRTEFYDLRLDNTDGSLLYSGLGFVWSMS